VAERKIALMHQYNDTLTLDEAEKQRVVMIVDEHRKCLRKPTKKAIATMTEL